MAQRDFAVVGRAEIAVSVLTIRYIEIEGLGDRHVQLHENRLYLATAFDRTVRQSGCGAHEVVIGRGRVREAFAVHRGAERHGRRSARIESIAQRVADIAVPAPPPVLADLVYAVYIRRIDQSLSCRALGTEGVDQIAEDAAGGKHGFIGIAPHIAIVVDALAEIEVRRVVPTGVAAGERHQNPLRGIDVAVEAGVVGVGPDRIDRGRRAKSRVGLTVYGGYIVEAAQIRGQAVAVRRAPVA